MIGGIIIGVLILFVVGYLLLNVMYRRTNAYKNSSIEIRGVTEGLKREVAIVNTGSTYSRFAFEECNSLKIRGLNLSFSPQSIAADYALLKAFSKHIPPGSVVCITLAACAMLYRQSMRTDNSLYYTVIGQGINEFKLSDWLKSKLPLFPLKIRKGFHIIKDVLPKHNLKNNSDTVLSEEKAIANMVGLAEVWMKLFHLSDLTNTWLSDVNKRSLEENEKLLFDFVSYCKSKSWRAVFVVTPFSKHLNCLFSEDFTEAILTSLIHRVSEQQGIPVFNYQHDKAFQDDLSLYVDGGFRLSKRGGTRFIKMLFADMAKRGYKADNSTMGIYG